MRPQTEPLTPWRLVTYNFFGFDGHPMWDSKTEQRWVRLVRPWHHRPGSFADLPDDMQPADLILGPAVALPANAKGGES